MGICSSKTIHSVREPLLEPENTEPSSPVLTECQRLLECAYKADELRAHMRVLEHLCYLERMGLLVPPQYEYMRKLEADIKDIREELRQLA
jgi:hypothetical protein